MFLLFLPERIIGIGAEFGLNTTCCGEAQAYYQKYKHKKLQTIAAHHTVPRGYLLYLCVVYQPAVVLKPY